jgi:hypothetical protein
LSLAEAESFFQPPRVKEGQLGHIGLLSSAPFLGQLCSVLSRALSRFHYKALVAAPPMSQLAWGFVSNPNRLLFLSSSGPSCAQGRCLAGLASRDAASLHGNPRWMGRRHVTGAFLGPTHPQGALRHQATAGHQALWLPVMRSWVGPRDPLQIGWGFNQLAWGWGVGRTQKEDMVNSLACPIHCSLS